MGEKDRRTISVSADADVKVVPDQVVLTLGVESLKPAVAEAKADNDERVRRVFAAAHASGVEDKRIQTDQISIEPRWQEYGERRTFLGYLVRKTICLTLGDLARFEALLGGALEAGADHVHGVQFMTTRLREHRDEARALAIKAARDKATALAGELGMKVGLPRAITDAGGGWWSSYGYWGGGRHGGMSQNVMQSAGAAAEAGGATAPGTISVTASVGVTFDLE
jgi:uncharacterized protein YggE